MRCPFQGSVMPEEVEHAAHHNRAQSVLIELVTRAIGKQLTLGRSANGTPIGDAIAYVAIVGTFLGYASVELVPYPP